MPYIECHIATGLTTARKRVRQPLQYLRLKCLMFLGRDLQEHIYWSRLTVDLFA